MGAFASLTVRANGQNILASWFNSIRTALLGSPQWVKYTVTHTQLQAAATTNNIEAFELPILGVVHAVHVKHSEAFAGGTLSAYTVSVGIAGTLTKYTAVFDVFQAIGDGVYQNGSLLELESHASATSIKISAVGVGDNLDQSSAGSVDVWVLRSVLP